MRIRSQKQLYLNPQSANYTKMEEFGEIGKILDKMPEYDSLLNLVSKDLQMSELKSRAGAKGMTCEQVLRSQIVKSRYNCSYRELSEKTYDSLCVRKFLNINPWTGKGFNYKTLQKNIKLLSITTLDYFNFLVKKYSEKHGIEKGDQIRTDGTVIETNIHYPSDWSLMHDCNLVLSRCLTRLLEDCQAPIEFMNHYRASKRRLYEINNCRNQREKREKIITLIRLCKKSIKYAEDSVYHLNSIKYEDTVLNEKMYDLIISELNRVIPLAKRIVDVAYRRTVKKEKVSSTEKIFSIFEVHTDIIVKGFRDVLFGHKVTTTTGSSGLILDVTIHEGNPNDSTLTKAVLERHVEFYEKVPESMSFDGCYYSGDNVKYLESKEVKSFTFCKEKNTSLSNVARKTLRFFRAGIEATISMLKRMFGWKRIYSKGEKSFHREVKASAVAYNLFLLSRYQLKKG